MPFFNPYVGNFMNSAAPLQGSASMHGGVHTIPSLHHHHHQHHQQHHGKGMQMHHYGTPYIPFLGSHHDPAKALAMIPHRGLMFRAILKATIKLYFELGVLMSMMMGTLWFMFGSAFTRVVQTALHGVGNAFLHLGSSIHSSKT